MKLILAATAAFATLATALPAQAQVNERQWRQHHRIAQGYHRGELTRREAYRLQRQQARIRGYEHRSRWDDGRLSRRERQRLARMQNRADRNIYYQRRDYQNRRDWRW